MAKTLVTGAAGFIGSHVTRMLLEREREVRVMLRPGEEVSNLEDLDVERVVGDLRDEAAVRRAVEGCDRVFHLAAIYAIWLPDPSVLWDVNVGGTRTICQAALDAGVERMVYTSSIAALGVLEGDTPATEETPYNQWTHANDYIFSKYVSELEAREYIRRGLPAVIVNPAFPFGWGDVGPTPTGRIVQSVLEGRFPGWADGGFNAVDVEDVARGHLLAEEHGRVGERYLLCNENLSFRDFVMMVGEIAGVKVPDRRLPVSVMAGMGWLMEQVAERLTHRQPFLTPKTVRYATQSLYYDCTKSRQELGYDPRPVRESIERAVRWFRHRELQS